MASLVSSSLKTGRLIFIWPPGSLQGCLPQCGCLDPPIVSQTLKTLMMKLTLCSYHSLIHGLMRAKVTGVEPPITPVFFGLCSGHAVAHNLVPAVLTEAQAEALPIIQQSPGGWLIMGTNLDYGN